MIVPIYTQLAFASANEKPSRWVPGGLPNWFGWLCANYIGRLKALGALEQVKLHGFAFV